ncbi:MAG: hypothetical protein IKF19_02230 [Bacilli bacterium]|nr:hypothetical protein [Bacilli bacterium]
MDYKIDYLLKYVSNDTYSKIKNSNNDYLLSSLEHSRVDVDLNIRYLIKYGINNIDSVIYERLEDLILSHNEFIKMINKYEISIGKEAFIDMYENI